MPIVALSDIRFTVVAVLDAVVCGSPAGDIRLKLCCMCISSSMERVCLVVLSIAMRH